MIPEDDNDNMYGTYQMGGQTSTPSSARWPVLYNDTVATLASMTDLIPQDLNSLAISYIREV
jgi:hypothetical protein